MSTQLDEVAEELEAVRLNGKTAEFAEQQHEDAGHPDVIRDFTPVLETIDEALALIDVVEANPTEERPRKRLRETTGMLRQHARRKYGQGVMPVTLQRAAKALTSWDDGDDVDLDAVRHNLSQVRTATKTMQEAHETLVQTKEGVRFEP